jgi:hypothetical protein
VKSSKFWRRSEIVTAPGESKTTHCQRVSSVVNGGRGFPSTTTHTPSATETAAAIRFRLPEANYRGWVAGWAGQHAGVNEGDLRECQAEQPDVHEAVFSGRLEVIHLGVGNALIAVFVEEGADTALRFHLGRVLTVG